MSSSLPIAISGEQFLLEAGDYRAVVVSIGGGVRTLEYRGRALLDGYGPQELCEGARGQLLVPWPNRVEDGCYEFTGSKRQLDITEPKRHCAIHGFLRWVPWQLADRDSQRLTLTYRLYPQPGYPHILDLEVRYRLDAENGLAIEFKAKNVGVTPAPYGLGMHPYLTVGTPKIDTCELTIPADSWLSTDERGIPRGGEEPVDGSALDFRVARIIGSTAIDFAFAGLHRDTEGRATVTLRDPQIGCASHLWVDESFPWLEIFTGDHLPSRQREGLGVEPMTCPPNAFATGRDVVVLDVGGEHTARWGIWGSE
jgi:aldose 1-epimerase